MRVLSGSISMSTATVAVVAQFSPMGLKCSYLSS